MEDLSSIILLPIFKLLDSFEILKIRPVCKKWLDIIDENKSVWRRPILPKSKTGWPVSTLELFDRKSQSTLKEVSFSPQKAESKEYALLGQILERSKSTLRVLSIRLKDSKHYTDSKSPICTLPKKIPGLVEFKILHPNDEVLIPRVTLGWNEVVVSNGRLGSGQKLSNLKVLWGWEFPILFESHLNLLNNISSLCLSYPFKSFQWRRILEVPSKTLKHLEMTTTPSENGSVLSTLQFPKLRVIQLWISSGSEISSGSDSIFDWMRIPTTSILISERSGLPPSLPSVSVLCIPDLKDIQELKGRCPLLVELEVGRGSYARVRSAHIEPKSAAKLISVLKERKKRSEGGSKVDGVQMNPLKRLVIPFDQFEARIKELRGLVEEVIDLESVSPLIEVEI